MGYGLSRLTKNRAFRRVAGPIRRYWRLARRNRSGSRPQVRGVGGRLELMGRNVRHEECDPLIDPPFVPASPAAHMRDDDVVLGVAAEGEARAYPWWIMDNHHMANDVVGGRPVAILLCEACSTGMAFDALVDGRRLTFEASYVFNGTLALRDHQTGSVWSPYLSMAIRGELAGRSLELLPLTQMEWRAWRELHPGTLVLPPELGARHGHGSDHTIGAGPVPKHFRDSLSRLDRRLEPTRLVLGVVLPDEQRVYPLDAVREAGGVVNDRLGGTPLVVLAHLAGGSYGALAFSRRLDGRELTFEAGPDGPVDAETRSVWTVEGVAVDGPLAGSSLSFVPSHVSEWYIWGAHFPELQIFARPEASAGEVLR